MGQDLQAADQDGQQRAARTGRTGRSKNRLRLKAGASRYARDLDEQMTRAGEIDDDDETTWTSVWVLATVDRGAACHHKTPPVARPAPPPAESPATADTRPPTPPPPRRSSRSRFRAEPLRDDSIASASLDDLNRNSPLKPVFFEYDSADINADAQVGARRERGDPEALSDAGR